MIAGLIFMSVFMLLVSSMSIMFFVDYRDFSRPLDLIVGLAVAVTPMIILVVVFLDVLSKIIQ
jgi:hypothetical protein